MGLQKVGPDIVAGFVGKAQMKPKPDGVVEVVTSKPVISTEHAKTIAKAVLNYYAYGFVQGDGSTFGDPALHAGSTLEHRAAVSIGTNPHYGGTERRIEPYLLDFDGDLYGRRLVVELWERLRDEEVFGDEQALIEQIARDVEAARAATRPG